MIYITTLFKTNYLLFVAAADNMSELTSEGDGVYNESGTIEKTLYLRAPSAETRLQWVTMIKAAMKCVKSNMNM